MTARLRLLLAILLLALAPVPAPAAGWVAAAPALATLQPHDCDHPCDAPVNAEHAQAACPCAPHLTLAPLVAIGQVMPVAVEPVVAASPFDATLSARWPPPLRPPRC